MTTKELITFISKEHNIDLEVSKNIIEGIFNKIKNTCNDNDKILIKNFGVFYSKNISRTIKGLGNSFEVEKTYLKFKSSKNIKDNNIDDLFNLAD